MDASVSVSAAETAELDEDQQSEDEPVVLLLLRARGVKQKCQHATRALPRFPTPSLAGQAKPESVAS
jgi:hypothetical protein